MNQEQTSMQKNTQGPETEIMLRQKYRVSFITLLFFLFILGYLSSLSQKITTGDFLYRSYLSKDTMLNDSALSKSVAVLFEQNNTQKTSVLFYPSDTSYYTYLNHCIFIIPNKDWFEINLLSLSKRDDGYLLKCMIFYSIPDGDVTNFIGFLNLPFILVNGSIKFKNYFNEIGIKNRFVTKNQKLFVNHENAKNADSISVYTSNLAALLKIEIDTSKKLYYVHLPDGSSAYQFLGFEDYTLDFQSRLLSFNNLIILDKTGKGFYRHELTHYVMEKQKVSRFISEGIASYFGGSSGNCNMKCDYEMLLSFLKANNSDTTLKHIFNEKVTLKRPYCNYYYQLGSITIQLVIEKYGYEFLNNEKLMQELNTTSFDSYLKFMTANFKQNEKSLSDFYINKLEYYIQTLK